MGNHSMELPAKRIACGVVLPMAEVTVLLGSCGIYQYISLLEELRLLCARFVEPGLLIGDLVGHTDHSLCLGRVFR